jgi:hypothetical protein
MENEKLIANYIIQSGEYGLSTRSDLTKGLRNELKTRTITNYGSLDINKIEKGVNTFLNSNNLDESNQNIILSNLEDMLKFLPEDSKEGGNLLDILAPNQNDIYYSE